MAQRPAGRRINPLYVVLGAVALLGVVVLLLTTMGGEEQPPAVTPAPRAAGAPGLRTPSPAPTTEPMEVFEVFEGRDPFRPLVVPGAPGASPAPTATPAPRGPGRPARTPPPPRTGVQVEVLAVNTQARTATVRVGSEVRQNVKAGDSLPAGIVVEAIEGKCVDFRRDGSRFRLCEGEQVLK